MTTGLWARFRVQRRLSCLAVLFFICNPAYAALWASPNPSTGSYTVGWGGVNGAYSYRLYETGTSTPYLFGASVFEKSFSNKAVGFYTYRLYACWIDMSGPTFEFGENDCGYIDDPLTVRVSPPVPTGLNGPSIDHNGDFTVSWNAAAGSTSKLRERLNSGAWSTVHSGSAESDFRPNRTPGAWRYSVRACNGSNCSNWSAAITVQVPVPAVPTGLDGPPTDYNGDFTVSWNAAAGYTSKLRERLNSGAWSTVHSGAAESDFRPNRTPGAWRYSVRACSGSNCSSWSAAITVQVQAPPAVPTGLNGPPTDYNGAFTMTWNSAARATSYRLRETGPTTTHTYVVVGTSKGITGKLDAPGTYSYRVTGCNPESVCGGWSGYVDVHVEERPDTPELHGPEQPVQDDESYTISWSDTDAEFYELEEQPAGGSWQPVPGPELLSRTRSNDAGTYSYRARACHPENACSGWSSSIAVTVQLTYTTTYQYDAQGRLIQVKHPNGIATDYDYDSADNRTSKESSLEN